ncbi:MAG TPA: alanine racemase [Synergistales bacterium]|nr:alanine racemase [Synergistales bacterium]
MLLRPTCLEVYIDQLRKNYREVRRLIPPDCEVIAVVKADAYSHGAVEVSRIFEEEGCKWFAVATADEALELRNGNINGSILVLGASIMEAAETYITKDISPACGDLSFLRHMNSEAAKLKKPGRVHLKFDTGLGRTGFTEEDLPELVRTLSESQNIMLEGAFTHFATADEENLDYTRWQFSRFRNIMATLSEKGWDISFQHVCNSPATVNCPEMALNAVRPGNLLYGLPSGFTNRKVCLHPSCSLKTKIVVIREIPPRSGIGYGLTYMTRGQERIGILPIGFYDGLSRLLSGKAEVLVRGKRVPVVGTICLDQCMINLTSLPEAGPGDEVVVIGKQGQEEISMQEIADKLDTVVTQVLSFISKRVPRVYL